MPFWMSVIAGGQCGDRAVDVDAALSTASSSERACPSEDSAARIASTKPDLPVRGARYQACARW